MFFAILFGDFCMFSHSEKEILIENNVETRMNDDFDHKTTIWIYISLKYIFISSFCLSTGDEKDTAANASSEKQILKSLVREMRIEAFEWPALQDSNLRPSESESGTLSS